MLKSSHIIRYTRSSSFKAYTLFNITARNMYSKTNFSFIIFLPLENLGFGCSRSFSDISLKQSKTGKMVKNTPEWEVTLTNPCSCTGTDITLTCDGFKSLTPIDPSQILVAGDECSLINNLYGETDFVFKYVWAEEFDIKIKSGEIACS